MKIVIAGATGVVGRRAVPLLLAQGHQVTAAVRDPTRAAGLERAGARVERLDLFDAEAARRVFRGHDVVVSLATHIPRSAARMLLPGAWRENDRVRREGSAVLSAAAADAGVGRYVQESFAPVYPGRGVEWIDETVPIAPVRYNRSVADAEESAARFTRGGGTGVVLRFAGFYGPDATQVKDAIGMVRRGWAPLPGPPDAFFSSVSHDDAATAVVAALGVPAGAWNVVDDEPVTRHDYAAALAAALGLPAPKPMPGWMPKLMGSLGEMLSRSQRMSNRKLRDATGWTPRYPSVREGWPATIREMNATAG